VVERLGPVVVQIVEVGDVESVGVESSQALLDGAQDGVAAEIPLSTMGCGCDEPLSVQFSGRRALRGRYERAPHLRREQVLLARTRAKGNAEAALRQADPVVRRGVEIADAGFPGSVHRLVGILIGGLAVQVAQLRAAEPEFGECWSPPERAGGHPRGH
jgi:hypothetical protein